MSLLRILILIALLGACQCNSDIAKSLARMVMQVAQQNGIYDGPVDLQKTSYGSERNVVRERSDEPKPRVDEPIYVDTTSGLVEGITLTQSHAFYEIPYAEPPVGSLRFQPPEPIKNPKAITATENSGLQCHQVELVCLPTFPDLPCNRLKMSEDCLVLNVFVPTHVNLSDASQQPTERLPVLFYIHGGSFNAGSGTRSSLDGEELSNVTNSVVVAINYRLGPYGFLVQKEAGLDDITGNQGLKDQQLALQWVQDNIASFGGDKSRVTIFGNSAGAQSVMFHTLSEISKPMYAGAIQQSNPAFFYYQTPEESLRITEHLSFSLRCNSTISQRECLMNADPIAINNRQIAVMGLSFLNRDVMGLIEPYRPVIDGVEFTKQSIALFKEGTWNSEKNMIVGVNTQELEDIQYYLPEAFPFTESLFTFVNYYIFGVGTTDTVVKKYEADFSPGPGEDWSVTFGLEMSHLIFDCPSRAMARHASQSKTGEGKVYYYANYHPVLDQLCQNRNNGSDSGCYYSTHADEVRFVFRTVSNPSDDDRSIENQFSTYWGSFAREGNPNSGLESELGDYATWPEYELGDQQQSFVKQPALNKENYAGLLPFIVNSLRYQVDPAASWQNIRIQAPVSEAEVGFEEDICDFWDSIGYYMDPILPATTTTTTTVAQTEPPVISTTSGAVSNFNLAFLSGFLCTLLSIDMWF